MSVKIRHMILRLFLGVRIPKSRNDEYPETMKDIDLKKEFTPEKYYAYLRKEIQREDDITNQRLTWAMAFQGFLITAMTFLISGSWIGQPEEIADFRKLSIGAIGFVGLFAAIITTSGLDASRNALDQVVSDWEAINNKMKIVPQLAPRTYGEGKSYSSGSLYARLIPRLFFIIWLAYIVAYSMVMEKFFRGIWVSFMMKGREILHWVY